MRIILYFTALLLVSLSVQSSNEINTSFSMLASSEPVSIDDMVNGWDGSYQQGELAFADVKWDVGFSKDINIDNHDLGRLSVSRGYRIYYFLKFDKETADFYRALDQKKSLSGNKKLDLEIKHFQSPSLSFAYLTPKLDFPALDFESQFSLQANLYQPGHRQFGEIKGMAFGPKTTNFSATIDYRYDQFKLPWLEAEKGFDTEKGQGYSFDLGATFEQQRWLLDFKLTDILASFYWKASGVTTACLQIELRDGAVCKVNGGNGRSEVKSVTETIPMSASGLLRYKDFDLSLHVFKHDAYKRVGIEKGLKTELGRLGFFLYYPRLVGLSWQADVFNIELGSDDLKLSQARNFQLNMGLNWRW